MNYYNNKGYVGYSRSVRSEEAVENFEVPLSMINKDLIEDYLNSFDEKTLFTKEEIDFLKNTKVALWKFAAKENGATSWHHTGAFYNATDHYDLNDISNYMVEHKDTLEEDYKKHLIEKKKEKELKKQTFKYGVIKVQIWGGSRARPKIVDYETEIGIVESGWLYYKCGSKIKKYKTDANKTEEFKEFDSYKELVKAYPEYKGRVKEFNTIIKNRKLK